MNARETQQKTFFSRWFGWLTDRSSIGGLIAAITLASMTTMSDPALSAQMPDSFAPLVEKVRPAVVNISTTELTTQADNDENAPEIPQFPPGSPFEEFFKGMRPPQNQPRKATALGSGFVIDSSGIVVTNNHVVEHGTDIKVTLQDGTSLPATLVGRDERTDLAVLQVKPDRKLASVEFGDSDKAKVGDWVLAVGNPFGLGGTVTAGIVSARSRDIHAGPYDDFLQIDASINRGNSGGPTFNLDGQVIGVNTAILSPSGGSVGIGFAIPSNIVKTVVAQLQAAGKVKRGWLGVAIQPISPDIAEAMKLKNTNGALVSTVNPKSPADLAGIRSGDVIVQYAGKPINSLRDLTRAVADTPVGSSAIITVMREGQSKDLKAVIAELKDDPKVAAKGSDDQKPGDDDAGATTSTQLGLKLAGLSDQTRQKFDIGKDVEFGVVVIAIAQGSKAADLGIAPGDVIQRVNDQSVKSPADLKEAVKQAGSSGRKAVALLINRRGSQQFVAVPLQNG